MGVNILENGLAWLTGQLKDHASEDIIYARGDEEIATTAVVGKTLLKLDDGAGGIRMEWTDATFSIPLMKEDGSPTFDFGSGPQTPLRGDRVLKQSVLGVMTFEVFPFSSDPPYVVMNESEKPMVKVYTKRINLDSIYS